MRNVSCQVRQCPGQRRLEGRSNWARRQTAVTLQHGRLGRLSGGVRERSAWRGRPDGESVEPLTTTSGAPGWDAVHLQFTVGASGCCLVAGTRLDQS